MAKMNPLQVGLYMATGKLLGKLPIKGTNEVALKIAQEGIVLLKNDGVLPIKEESLALFGAGSKDTTICGTGSGYAFSPYTVSIYDGLVKAGYDITSNFWLNNYDSFKKHYKGDKKLSLLDVRFSGITPCFDVKVLTQEEIDEAKSSDIALYVIKRNTGENFDRTATAGDYYLSDNEKRNIGLLSENFEKVVVILNTCVVDCKWLSDNEKVSAIIQLGQAGLEAGNALADIISGKISPSGRLTDTYALSYDDYPASKTFSNNDGNTLQEDYLEDIYVGYRYFDSKKLDIVYPFGYGLSYSKFEYSNYVVDVNWNEVRVSLDVKNVGEYKSKEVVQFYVSAPNGKLNKPYQELKAYIKTKELDVNESQNVTLTFKTKDLASYDEASSSWLMEKGKYLLRVGDNSRNTNIIGAIVLDEDVTTIQLSKQLELDRELDLLKINDFDFEDYNENLYELKADNYKTINEASKISKTLSCYVSEDYETKKSNYNFKWDNDEEVVKVREINNATLLDVVDKKITMEEFVATLDDEVLVRFLTGAGEETKYEVAPRLPKNAFKSKYNTTTSGITSNLFAASLGIPACSLADGPAGLHIMGSPSTAYPVGMVCAQTFNPELIYEVGNAYGKEMECYDVSICLGPGMNIHRDPLCGRNFEYYSEDPLVTGLSATYFTSGLQENHEGLGVAIKHFCANNQELDRTRSNSSISERALREIYLKGFEICVKEAKPLTVMSSYNELNGIHTSSRYDLLTDVLRGEWGFEGFVMTDWGSLSDKLTDIVAGNDIIMGGYDTNMIMSWINSKDPEFNEDGSIKKDVKKIYGGVMTTFVNHYNSFSPDKDGTYIVEVKYNGKIPEDVKKLIEEGIVEVDEENKIFKYKGFNRANTLKKSVVQRNVMRVLNYLAYGAPMKYSKGK